MRKPIELLALGLCLSLMGCDSAPGKTSTTSEAKAKKEDLNKTSKAEKKTAWSLGDQVKYGGFTWKFLSLREEVDVRDREVHYALRYAVTNDSTTPRPPCRLTVDIVDSTGHQADKDLMMLGDKSSWDGDKIYGSVTVQINRWTQGRDPLDGDLTLYLAWQNSGQGMMADEDKRCPKHTAQLKIPATEWVKDAKGRVELAQKSQ